jgi:hypothetical protein
MTAHVCERTSFIQEMAKGTSKILILPTQSESLKLRRGIELCVVETSAICGISRCSRVWHSKEHYYYCYYDYYIGNALVAERTRRK